MPSSNNNGSINEHIKIGLEIHCQLTALKSKLFCPCSSDYRGKEPNSNVCPICMGLPGTLPLLNRKAVEYAIMIALALNCSIPERLVFYRKNYFYPDLPKNFQITQYNSYEQASVGSNGYLELDDGSTKRIIRIRRIQLEEDPGRLVYESISIDRANYTLVDYNRAGVALVEIVTEPDFNSPEEVRIFLNKLASILEHLGVCNTELEGAVRCDANVSFADNARVEIKNINSFKEVERAIVFEITRQRSLLARGIKVTSETRHWDDVRRITIQSRAKEEEQDYRYFPEQDIPVVHIADKIDAIKAGLPELPDEKVSRFVRDYSLQEHTARILVNNRYLSDFFEECVKHYSNAREIANWIISDLKGYIDRDKDNVVLTRVTPKHIAELVMLIDSNKINRSMAKQIMHVMVSNGDMPSSIVKSMCIDSITSEDELREIVKRVIIEEEKAVKDAMINEKAFNYLLGKVMRYTKGRAEPKLVLELLKDMIINNK
jgi:aspartyl-tRNA(Asn)/glutamyl-tRNA(Gln) amidotransferase subunit B